jgi:hypothetical protein
VDDVATTLETGLTWSLPPAWVNMTGLSGAVYNKGGLLNQIGASGLDTKVLVNGNGFDSNVSDPAICVHCRASDFEVCTVPALLLQCGLTRAALSPLQFPTFAPLPLTSAIPHTHARAGSATCPSYQATYYLHYQTTNPYSAEASSPIYTWQAPRACVPVWASLGRQLQCPTFDWGTCAYSMHGIACIAAHGVQRVLCAW